MLEAPSLAQIKHRERLAYPHARACDVGERRAQKEVRPFGGLGVDIASFRMDTTVRAYHTAFARGEGERAVW